MKKSLRNSLWIHAFLIITIAIFSFSLNQVPFLFSSKPYSIGNDGDSAIHVAIQMKSSNPALFSKDVELNEMFMHSRPVFEFIIHRTVIWIGDHLFGGNLFAANITSFWFYHLFFIIGCYLIAWVLFESFSSAALFAASSVGLSMALMAWWGMVYGAVIPHDIGITLVPWFVLGYLRWIQHPRRMVMLFFALGLAVNVYPLQPAFLGIILLACTFFRHRPPLRQTTVLGASFVLGALPSVFISLSNTFGEFAGLNPSEQAVVDALFVRHYGYLLFTSGSRTIRLIATSPVGGFLAVAGMAFFLKKRKKGLNEKDKELFTFTMWTGVISFVGLVMGAIYPPLITFFFHRASSFLYIPAYLGCSWLATHWILHHTVRSRIVGVFLALLMLLNSMWYTALSYHLRGVQYMQSSQPYYALAGWAAENTPLDSLFMVPIGGRNSYYAFRVYSKRGVLLHGAAGEAVLSNPRIGTLFWSMLNDIEPLYKQPSDTTEFVSVANKYHVDYIITDRTTPRLPNLPIVYRNEIYTVFVVPTKGHDSLDRSFSGKRKTA